jgi:cytochrome c peroxidase
MIKKVTYIAFIVCVFTLFSFRNTSNSTGEYYSISELKQLYSSKNSALWPKPHVDSNVVNFQDLGVLPKVQFPADNPYSEAKRELGKLLFFDPRLSGSQQISCSSCHDPQLGWSDGKKVSHGHNRTLGIRNSKSILNVGFAKSLFWDGRAGTLEEQVQFPIEDVREMNNHVDIAVTNIQNITGYKKHFKEAFGDENVSKDRIFKAIATFERTIVSKKSRFDKFIEGDSTQLNNKEVLGLHLFRTKARCINCHNSTNFTDEQFHNAGLTYYGRKYEDLGLYNLTKNPQDVGKFKTPSLRDITATAPYMHNGLFPHLRGVLNMYNAGMPNLKPNDEQLKDNLFPKTSPFLKKLDLNEDELDALEAFLKSISTVIYHEPEPENLPQ